MIVLGDFEDRILWIVEEDMLVGNVMREWGCIICEKELLGKNDKMLNIMSCNLRWFDINVMLNYIFVYLLVWLLVIVRVVWLLILDSIICS